MISCKVCAGECAISSAVMTLEDAPTMPLNCRPPPPDDTSDATFEPVPGAGLPLLVDAVLGAVRRGPPLSSEGGWGRGRFWSSGGLTSIGGKRSADAVCWAWAPELSSASRGTRKLDANQRWRRLAA